MFSKNTIFILLFLLLILDGKISFAQIQISDSLKQIYRQKNIQALEKVRFGNRLAAVLVASESDTAFKIASETALLAKKNAFRKEEGDANRILGIIFRVKSDLSSSFKHFIIAEKIYNLTSDSLSAAKNNLQIGTHYKIMRDYDKAQFYYAKTRFTIENRQEDFEKDEELYAAYIELNRNEAELSVLKKDIEKAEMYIQKNIDLDKKLGKKQNTAQYLFSLAVLLEKKNLLPEAYKKYQIALDEKLKSNSASSLALYYVYLGGVASKMNKTEEAEKNLFKGLAEAEKSNAVSMIAFAHTRLSEHFERKKDFALAMRHHKTSARIKDSVFNKENADNLAKIQSKFELDKKQAEIDLLEKDKKIGTLVQAGLGIIIIFGLLLFSLSVFFAYKNSKKNKLLQVQNIEITQKNAILEQQQEEIRTQHESVKLLNEELNDRKIILEEKNTELQKAFRNVEEKNYQIVSSIRYAQQIQVAALPFLSRIQKSLPDSFVFYKPKDIVSGDFYWFAAKKDKIYLASADCTGHGVPGAFMSLIGMNFLAYLVNERGIEEPNKILEGLDLAVKMALKQEERQNSDGIAIGLLCFDRAQMRLHYSGANNTLYYAVDKELYAVKGDKFSVGGYRKARPDGKRFVLQEVPLQKNTIVYLVSDGFQDQIGGGAHKRFTSTNLKMLLLDAAEKNFDEQKDFLENSFLSWQGNEPQTDDVLVFGSKIPF